MTRFAQKSWRAGVAAVLIVGVWMGIRILRELATLKLPERATEGVVAVAGSDSPVPDQTPTLPSGGASAAHYWPQWRRSLGTGVAPHADPPVEWSEDDNIRWKIELPGKGHSTPVIWGRRIFITTAVPVGEALPPKFSGAPIATSSR